MSARSIQVIRFPSRRPPSACERARSRAENARWLADGLARQAEAARREALEDALVPTLGREAERRASSLEARAMALDRLARRLEREALRHLLPEAGFLGALAA